MIQKYSKGYLTKKKYDMIKVKTKLKADVDYLWNIKTRHELYCRTLITYNVWRYAKKRKAKREALRKKQEEEEKRRGGRRYNSTRYNDSQFSGSSRKSTLQKT